MPKAKKEKPVPLLRWSVNWEVDLIGSDAENPLAAAMKAREDMISDGWCHIFTVTDNATGKKYSVDLDEIEGDEVIELK